MITIETVTGQLPNWDRAGATSLVMYNTKTLL